MDARDRWHAVAVARAVLRMQPAASNRLVRAALLHDVGKSVRPYRLHERIAGHLLPRRWLGKQRGSAGYVAKHHARIGGAMIREAGGSDDVARLVERHERFGTNDDPELAVLVTADRQT
jgi:putative nucleotidyltransferase with HDIG domain